MTIRAGICGVMIAAAVPAVAHAQTPPPAVARTPTIADAKPDAQGVRHLAIFRGLDKITGRARDVAAPVGVPVKFGTLTITAQFCHTVPPEEPPETTAFVQIDEDQTGGKPKRMFSGWMFASTPALNALEHPTFDVWVVNCQNDAPPPAATGAAPANAPPADPSATRAEPAAPKPAAPPTP